MPPETTPAAADQTPQAERPAAEVTEQVKTAGLADLAALEAEERAGKSRTSVLNAIEARRASFSHTDEPTYTAADLAATYSESGQRAMVYAAFQSAGVERLPLTDARELVDGFGKREAN